jgi:hypothetical protein
MTMGIKKTVRSMLAITVASSLMLSAGAVAAQNLRAPSQNPNAANSGGAQAMPAMRAPEANPNANVKVGAQYHSPSQQNQPQPAPQVQQQEEGGFFSWLWRSSPSQPQQQVNTMQRRVPTLNQNPDAQVGGNYQVAVPVPEVTMTAPMAQPVQQVPDSIIVADEVMVMDEPFRPMPLEQAGERTYPSLASVPPRPERLDALNEADARMADLQAARDQSMQQANSLDAQMAQDGGAILPQAVPQQPEPMPIPQTAMQQPAPMTAPATPAPLPQEGYGDDLEAEFAAIISGADSGAAGVYNDPQPVTVVEETTPPVVVSGDTQTWDQAPAPVQMAGVGQSGVGQSGEWQPTPLVEPQTAMTPQAPVVQQDEWVSLQQDPSAQMAVPVEQVSVGNTPMVASVSAIPVVPEGTMAGGIRLTPPSRYGQMVRTLPESRYAARRQALYMQRYARQNSGGY